MTMTARAAAAALVARGLEPAEEPVKTGLFAAVLDRHRTLNGAEADVWWVPGRLEVFGKHTDYAGGRTLVCPVPRGFAVAASPRSDGLVRVSDAVRGESVTIAAGQPRTPLNGWRRYVEVAVDRLARNFPGAPLGAEVVIASDLPRAAGMSSSSALVIAVAAAAGRLARLETHPAWTASIQNGLDLAGYYACIENGRTFAALSGDGGVGTHGGSEDHTAIVEGQPRQVSAFAFVPPRPLGEARVPDGWRFVIAPSGVAARKTGDALGPYNRLSAGASLLLDAWNRREPPVRSLADALRSSSVARDRLAGLSDAIATPSMPAAWLRRRLDHFIREDARPLDALRACAAADRAALGVLSEESQRDAEDLLGNQIPATSALAATARRLGAFAACSFGAGFGGAVWALVEEDRAGEFARAWQTGAFTAAPGVPLTNITDI